jgi:potassium/chloride transporter 9
MLSTNFDTYTLILQLGCILRTVPSWKRTYKLRVAVFVEYDTDVEEERQRVTTLLTNLRIQAKVLVFWLANGELKMYEVIINGKSGNEYLQAAKDVDEALEDEEWWQDIQRWRNPGSMSSSQELAQVEGLLDTVGNWPTSSFQHGRQPVKPKRFAELRKMLHRTRRKSSLSEVGQLGLSVGMRTQRLPADLVREGGSSSESSLEASSGEEGVDSDDEEQEAASENDMSEYDLDASDSESDDDSSITPVRRAKSFSTDVALPFIRKKLGLHKGQRKGSPTTASSMTPLRPHPDAHSSDTTLLGAAKSKPSHDNGVPTPLHRPPPIRQQSLPKFTSKPTPRTKIATEDGPGPSIMFTDQPTPSIQRKQPRIFYEEPESETEAHAQSQAEPTNPTPSNPPPQPASGYPAQQSLPLSFNDLPCRAQHLILNELMRQQSKDTAVIFTTLPSPVEGTCQSEFESVKYMSDLEVLCQGLPPVLLVHSNSMTVTMNL